MNYLQVLSAIEIGLLYGLVAIGIYITFRIINFPDLTVDGTFTLGGAVSAALIISGVDPYFSTFTAVVAGGLAGFVTGYLHVRLGILGLLAGILTMTALYSVNLRIMGCPNIALIDTATFFAQHSVVVILMGVVSFVLLLLSWFFLSEVGLSIRAIGTNARVSRAYGINVNRFTIVTITLSNALVALAGSLFTQSIGFADISMGFGTLIVGLASVIIGEIFGQAQRTYLALVACVIGSIAYRIVIALALNSDVIGLEASDLNLVTAMIIALTMSLPIIKRKIVCWSSKKRL